MYVSKELKQYRVEDTERKKTDFFVKDLGEQKMELAPNQVRVFIIKAFFFRISLFVSPLIFGFILKAFLNVQATNDDAVSDFADILASTLLVEQYITPYWKVMDARCALCDHFLYSFFLWNFISLFFFVTVSGYFFPFSLSLSWSFASQHIFLLFAFLLFFIGFELVFPFSSLVSYSFSRVSFFFILHTKKYFTIFFSERLYL